AGRLLATHVASILLLRDTHVVRSRGVAWTHSLLWTLCDLLCESGVARITCLSTGLLLERRAAEVVRWGDEVTVSLDGSREVHDRIRNIPNAYDRLAAGVRALRALAPDFRVTARS